MVKTPWANIVRSIRSKFFVLDKGELISQQMAQDVLEDLWSQAKKGRVGGILENTNRISFRVINNIAVLSSQCLGRST